MNNQQNRLVILCLTRQKYKSMSGLLICIMSAKVGGWFWTTKTVISRPYCNNVFFLPSHFQLMLALDKFSMILDLLISLPLVLKIISD